jgi:hypothetical protein
VANISDKEQADIERAANDSAIRIQSFDGKVQQEGKTKFQPAYDLNPQGNEGGVGTDAHLKAGGTVGSHNDKAHIISEPGKA